MQHMQRCATHTCGQHHRCSSSSSTIRCPALTLAHINPCSPEPAPQCPPEPPPAYPRPPPLTPSPPHTPPQASDLYRILDKAAVGDKLVVEVLRGDATQLLQVVLDSSEVVPLTEAKPEKPEMKPELKPVPVPLPDGVPPEQGPTRP